ncbi:uncharacterized protein LOC143788242 [Ranitomeya variabilis]|uniref:uncharacterized protein LOC143788242 n=1 Tax=Ranitomeya variabilis TaxID=490064 RepID=UPI004055BE02
MLRLLKQKKSVLHKLDEDAVEVRTIVESREGKKAVKNVERLYKHVGLPSSGRLQPAMWNNLIENKRGMLKDKGLLEQAQAHLRVARGLKNEGWKEVDGEGGSDNAEPVFGYKMPLNCDLTDCKMAAVPLVMKIQCQPPPYNGDGPNSPEAWVCPACGVQNPNWVEICRVCGAGRPQGSAQIMGGSGACHTSSSGHLGAPGTSPGSGACHASTGSHLGAPGIPPQPLCPLVTLSGEYYQGPPLPEKPPAPTDAASTSNVPVPTSVSGSSLPVQPTVIFVNTPGQGPFTLEALTGSAAFQSAMRMRRQVIGDDEESEDLDNQAATIPPALPMLLGPFESPRPGRSPLPTPLNKSSKLPHDPEIWFPCHSRYYITPQGSQVLFSVGYGDILTHQVGAIVNPANSALSHRGGLAQQIAKKGGPSIAQECQAYLVNYGPLHPGDAMTTQGGNLPCDIVLHTAGPIYDNRTPEHCRTMLQTALQTVVILAGRLGRDTLPRRTLAVPLISSGLFGYPLGPCMKEHVEVIKNCLQSTPNLDLQEVRIVCYHESGLEGIMPLVAEYMVPLMHTGIKPLDGITPTAPPTAPEGEVVTHDEEEEELKLKYKPFTPVQIDAIVSKLCDPDKFPMQYVRRLEQIRSIYGATWSDLSGITSIRASEYFLPTIMKELDSTKAGPLNKFKSGKEFIAQLTKWAQDRLCDEAGSIQDIRQESGEAVEKYAARLTMQFEDLGYSTHVKTQAALLVRAFIDGLEDPLKDKVMKLRPELPDGPLKQALTVVKSYQKLLQREEKEAEKEAQKDKGKKKPAMYMAEVSEVPVMVYQAQDRYGPPSLRPRGPQGRNYRDRPFHDDQGRPLCWECGNPAHMRRDCPHKEHPRRLPPPHS